MTADPIAAARRYRKRPVVIEAMQFAGDNYKDVREFAKGQCEPLFVGGSVPPKMLITTLEGVMEASVGDWIIKGVKGEFYPCKPDIFEATYEACHD